MSIAHLEILYQLDRYDQLIEMAAPLQGEGSEGVQASLYAIAALMGKQAWPEAAALIARVRPACAAEPRYWYLSAKVLRQLDQLDEAEQALAQALKQAPSEPDFLCEKALQHWRRGQIGDAKRAMDQALAQDPLHAQTLLCMAVMYGTEIQRPDLGLRILRRYLAREPNCPNAHYLIAELEPRLWHKARHFRRLLSLRPQDQDAQQGYRRYGVRLRLTLAFCGLMMLSGLACTLWAEGASWQPWVLGSATLGMVFAAAGLFYVDRQWPGLLLASYGIILTLPLDHRFAALFTGLLLGGALTLLAYLLHLACRLIELVWQRWATIRSKP